MGRHHQNLSPVARMKQHVAGSLLLFLPFILGVAPFDPVPESITVQVLAQNPVGTAVVIPVVLNRGLGSLSLSGATIINGGLSTQEDVWLSLNWYSQSFVGYEVDNAGYCVFNTTASGSARSWTASYNNGSPSIWVTASSSVPYQSGDVWWALTGVNHSSSYGVYVLQASVSGIVYDPWRIDDAGVLLFSGFVGGGFLDMVLGAWMFMFRPMSAGMQYAIEEVRNDRV